MDPGATFDHPCLVLLRAMNLHVNHGTSLFMSTGATEKSLQRKKDLITMILLGSMFYRSLVAKLLT